MNHEPIPSILAAIQQGRADRSQSRPESWARHRAVILTLAQSGLVRGRIGGALGISSQQVTKMMAEACDAVLRGGMLSPEADRACAERWWGACQLGEQAACERLRRMAE